MQQSLQCLLIILKYYSGTNMHNGNSKNILDFSEHFCNKLNVRFSNEEKVNSLHDWKFSKLFCHRLTFFLYKYFYSKNSVRNTIKVSNSLDPDQA